VSSLYRPVRVGARLAGTLVLGAAFLVGAGCAVNPATGQTDFVLMSEDRELAIGRELHPQVLQHYGPVDDPALQAYVQSVGERIADHSHRSDLIYRFTVLDTADVNAFALPGGYVYITRGLLAYLGSEAELAAVLGHEIAHVTARHAVRQHSTATATGILGSILAARIGVQGAPDLANLLGTAMVRGYGREHELEADRLGVEYLTRAGYDPAAMVRVIRVLQHQELFERALAEKEGREPRVYHGVFATHPDNERRLQEVLAAAELTNDGSIEQRVGREEYLDHIDGLAFGDGAREGIRRGRHFFHGELGFALSFPEGWRVENLPTRLVARPPDGAALLMVISEELNRRIPPREFLEGHLQVRELSRGEAFAHHGNEGYTGIATINTPFGQRPTRVVVLYFERRAYVFAGAAKDAGEPFAYDAEFIETARSFRPLAEAERGLAEPQRLRVQAVPEGMTMADLARESAIPNHPEPVLRLLNGLYPEGEPAPGQLVKNVE
jgi:predicted Zn-dependent protease